MENFNEKVCLCALNHVFGFQPCIGIAMIDNIGSASGVFALDRDGLMEVLGPYSKYLERITAEALDSAAMELETMEKRGCRFIGYGESGYPAMLAECPDPSIGLYIRSNSSLEDIFGKHPCISIVGTRDISPYGREWTAKLVDMLCTAGVKPSIVSGMALGTDIAAHEAALRNNLPTIGVIPTGIDSMYPVQHIPIADRIARARDSAIITDYPPETAVSKVNFLRRNRIIAGLGRATILIESRIRGGGMMTARLACSYNRDVWAIPGRLDDLRSQGCNLLIREKVAEPVSMSEEFVERLGLGNMALSSDEDMETLARREFGDMADSNGINEIVLILKTIRKRRSPTPEEISKIGKLPLQTVSAHLGLLESSGIVRIDLLQRCTLDWGRRR